jgi:hypothetical protein
MLFSGNEISKNNFPDEKKLHFETEFLAVLAGYQANLLKMFNLEIGRKSSQTNHCILLAILLLLFHSSPAFALLH